MKAIVIDRYGSVEELKERQVLKSVVKNNEKSSTIDNIPYYTFSFAGIIYCWLM